MAKLKDMTAEAVKLVIDGGYKIADAVRFVIAKPGNEDTNFEGLRVNVTKKVSAHRKENKQSEPVEPTKKPAEKRDAKVIEPKPFVLSAWDFEGEGRMMGIDEYCTRYGLPREDVVSYKLITHTGTPYYNTFFKEVSIVRDVITEDALERMIRAHVSLAPLTRIEPVLGVREDWFDKATYTDAHIGMDTDKDGVAMFATPWNRAEQMRRAEIFVREILKNRMGNVLYVDELGDFMDGYNGYTTRGGHELPQNMSNEEAFDTGLSFKMYIVDHLMPYYDKIYFHNICNDNHAGSFGYMVNSAVKSICEAKYKSDRIEIVNQRQFINHYFIGRHAVVNTHGKDSKSLKFGFKPHLDPKQVEKIDQYLKQFGIYKKADFIEFGKGDSHQFLLDCCTSDDFDYFNFPAFAPASEWVQTNFKKSRSGFVIQNIKYDEKVRNIIPVWF